MKNLSLILLCFVLLLGCAPKGVMKPSPEGEPSLSIINGAGENAPSAQQTEPEKAPGKAPAEQAGKKPEPSYRLEEVEEEKYIVLNFENAELDTVISTFGDLLNMNYILSPGITGKVTIQSYKKFPTKDLFHVFQSILELNGLTAVKDGSLYRIVQIDAAKQQPVPIEKGKGPALVLDAGFVTQIIPLDYVKAADASNLLQRLAPRGTDIVIYEPSNLVIVTALPATLNRFMKLIQAIDIEETERESLRTFVYHVENGEAKKLEGILKSIYAEKKDTFQRQSAVQAPAQVPQTPPLPPGRRQPVTPPSAGMESVPGEVGEMTITAYEDINALIIKTTPRAYLSLLELLKRLDEPVKQVLIEVLVAEVTLGDSTQFGIEWLLSNVKSGELTLTSGGFAAVNPDTGAMVPTLTTTSEGKNFGGFIQGIFDSTTLNMAVSSLASQSKLNVLASPHILAMDNKEAKIEIGSEVPVATGLTQQPATAEAGVTLVTTGQIQYKTVGTLLTVTPHITERNKVTLKISQEVSQVSPTAVLVANQAFQSFDTRKANTTAVVESGHTLLIGGLMRQSKNYTRSGIPFLSSIPILGYLFSTTAETFDKTELILMVTPHVVNDQNEADALTQDFKNRIRIVKKEIEEHEASLKKDLGEEKAKPAAH